MLDLRTVRILLRYWLHTILYSTCISLDQVYVEHVGGQPYLYVVFDQTSTFFQCKHDGASRCTDFIFDQFLLQLVDKTLCLSVLLRVL